MATIASMTYNGLNLLPTDNTRLSYVHESFPPGIKLGTPRYQRKSSMESGGSSPRKLDTVSYRDRMSDLSLPRLPFDNYPLTPRRNKNCSFVNNHKAYLRLKGYQLNDVYSIRRRRSDSNGKKDPPKSPEVTSGRGLKKLSVGSTIDLPSVYLGEKSPREKKRQWQTIEQEVWRPEESRRVHDRNRGLAAFNKQLDRELHVPGHIRSRDSNSLKLGKVLTQNKLRQLLSEDKVTIPSVFYL